MPTAAGAPIFEDVVVFLQSKPSPTAISQNMDMFTGGLVDLVNRVRNLEFRALEEGHRLSVAEVKLVDAETRLNNAEADRTSEKARLDAIEKAPAEQAKRLDEMDKRVRTVEGAVGSVAFNEAKTAPAPAPVPPVGVKPTDPVKP